jgi:hypothetical protein
MSTYRSGPKRLEPAIIREGKSWLLTGILLVCLIPFIGAQQFFSRSSLTCTRATDSCVVEIVQGPEVWKSTRELRQSSIKEAFVDESVNRKGIKLWGTALRVDNETVSIEDAFSASIEEKYELAKTVNAYLKDPKKDHFEIHNGYTWPSFVFSFLILLVIVAIFRARTRFIIDYERRLFRIEERIFRTSFDDVPLDQVTKAVIYEEKDREGTVLTGVALQLADGSQKIIHNRSNIDRGIKARLLEQINDALSRVKQ